MSLHSIVGDGLAGRLLNPRRAQAVVASPKRAKLTVVLPAMSMRALETGLAIAAIATALLIGLGR